MKITNRKFQQEDFKDQSWIGRLLSPLNTHISEIFNAFQNQITVKDNLYQEIKSFTFVNEVSNFPIRIKTKFNKYPEGMTVIYCREANGAYPSVSPLIQWTFNDGELSMNAISGLTTSAKYTFKIHIIYE